jgi:hypothetical protein
VGALALGGFLVGLLMSLQQSLIGYTHTMLTSIITLFLPIMLMGCAIFIAEWFDR